MTDSQIVCPSCRAEIKLTESLAAPLIAKTRRKFDQQLAAKEADFGRREALLKQASEEIAKARESVEEQVATKLKAERSNIVENGSEASRQAQEAQQTKMEMRYGCSPQYGQPLSPSAPRFLFSGSLLKIRASLRTRNSRAGSKFNLLFARLAPNRFLP